MGLRERKKRPQVGQWMNVALGSPEERVFLGSPEERQGLGSPEEFWRTPYRTVTEVPPVLMRGSTGRWVVYVQQRLTIPITGVYDLGTEAAVRSVQISAGLSPTGMTDIATWAAIARLPFGANFTARPYGSYDPYAGSYGPSYYGYSYYPWWQTFRNPSRGSSTSPSGGGRIGVAP